MTNYEQKEHIVLGLSDQTSEEELIEMQKILKNGQIRMFDPLLEHLQFINLKLRFLNSVKQKPYQPFYSIEDCVDLFSKVVNIDVWNDELTCQYGIFKEKFGCPILETWGNGSNLIEKDNMLLHNFYMTPFSDSAKTYKDFLSYYLFGYKL